MGLGIGISNKFLGVMAAAAGQGTVSGLRALQGAQCLRSNSPISQEMGALPSPLGKLLSSPPPPPTSFVTESLEQLSIKALNGQTINLSPTTRAP